MTIQNQGGRKPKTGANHRRGKATYLKGMECAAEVAEANPDRAAEAIREKVSAMREVRE